MMYDHIRAQSIVYCGSCSVSLEACHHADFSQVQVQPQFNIFTQNNMCKVHIKTRLGKDFENHTGKIVYFDS